MLTTVDLSFVAAEKKTEHKNLTIVTGLICVHDLLAYHVFTEKLTL